MAPLPMNENETKNKVSLCLRSVSNGIARQRNIIAFWIFGMATTFNLVIILSAANDIFDPKTYSSGITGGSNTTTNVDTGHLYCNPTGTGLVLISAMVPELILKILVQFSPRMFPYTLKVAVTVISGFASFILLAFGNRMWISVIGVVFAGVSHGLGETAFLPLTSFYDKTTVPAWSAGTGAAGLSASLIYAGLTSLGVPRATFMTSMLVVPSALVITYLFVLKPDINVNDSPIDIENNALVKTSEGHENLTFKEWIRLIPKLLKYLLALIMIFLLLNFINQGLFELLYFNGQIITREEQYRWYHLVFRIGAFIARSGFKILIIRNVWVMPTLLSGIAALLTIQLFYRFIPYIWIVLSLVLTEGFVTGIGYVSTYMQARNNFETSKVEFALGLFTFALPIGSLLAGIITMYFHHYVCSLNLKI